MHDTWFDFNINRHQQLCTSQPGRLNKATLNALGTQTAAGFVCVLNTIDSLRRTRWTKVPEERWSSHTHAHSTNTHLHKDILVHQLMWLDPSCFMSAPGTLSLVISLVLSVFWIKQVCLHTATCLNAPLMRLLTLGFRLCFFVCVFWCDTLLMLWMREDRCLCVFLCGCGSDWKNETVDLKCYACLLLYTQWIQGNYTTVSGANANY